MGLSSGNVRGPMVKRGRVEKCAGCGALMNGFALKLDPPGQRLPVKFCVGCTNKVQRGEEVRFVNPNDGHPMSIGGKRQ